MKKLIFIFIIFIFLLGCKNTDFRENLDIDYSEQVSRTCEAMCNGALVKGGNFTNGPCLMDYFETFPGWVCDLVHSPRNEIDDNPQFQCPSYVQGRASHFVEVDMDCRIVRAK